MMIFKVTSKQTIKVFYILKNIPMMLLC